MHVVAVLASAAGGHTDELVGLVLDAAAAEGATASRIHLGYGPLAVEDVEAHVEEIARADGVVLGTPMYRATYTGVLKDFLDRLRRGGPDEQFASALRAKPVAIVATGASDHHFLGLDPLAALLVRFFGAYVVPPALYGSRPPAEDAALGEAAARLGRALAALGEAAAGDERLRAARPQV
jgi:FMN reductase